MGATPYRRLLPAVASVALAAAAGACGSGGEPVAPRPTTAEAAQAVRFRDDELGVSGVVPRGWYRARAVNGLSEPREVLALASYPLRSGGTVGECAPSTAREDLPPDGAFVWLLEYRPLRGEVWAELSRDRFPLRPERFDLRRDDLDENLGCFLGPGYSLTFRAADRPFQLLVAFGGDPTPERLEEVSRILDGLAFDELPAPPPDPYAGWTLINDDPGDSLRVPPGWAGAASSFAPRRVSRPRPLFFASNVPLRGLPGKVTPHVDALPRPFPSAALVAFTPDAVLVWVVEESPGGPSPHFPQIGRSWPSRGDFRVSGTEIAPELDWYRAGGSWRGYRFSVWLAAGPEAAGGDVELAFESAASLAVSGCGRDGVDDCSDVR